MRGAHNSPRGAIDCGRRGVHSGAPEPLGGGESANFFEEQRNNQAEFEMQGADVPRDDGKGLSRVPILAVEILKGLTPALFLLRGRKGSALAEDAQKYQLGGVPISFSSTARRRGCFCGS